jgi:hypothetical protein
MTLESRQTSVKMITITFLNFLALLMSVVQVFILATWIRAVCGHRTKKEISSLFTLMVTVLKNFQSHLT